MRLLIYLPELSDGSQIKFWLSGIIHKNGECDQEIPQSLQTNPWHSGEESQNTKARNTYASYIIMEQSRVTFLLGRFVSISPVSY